MAPEGWRNASVGTVGEVVAGKAKNTTSDAANRPYLRVANVFDGRIDVTDVSTMPFSDGEFERYKLQVGDVLLNEGQSLELVGRCAMYRGEYPGPCAIQNALIRFRAGPQVEATFAEQLFRWCQQSGVFAEIATQTTSIAHLGVKRFADLEVALPPLAEQRKIASILSSVDDAIDGTQAVIDQLQVVKKAMMAELLTRGLPGCHTRFKQSQIGKVPQEWDVGRIGDLLVESAYGTSAKCESGGQGLPVLRIPNVVAERITTDDLKFAVLGPADVERYKVSQGDILVIRTNGNPLYVGRTAVVPAHEGDWLYASYLIRLRIQRERMSPLFLQEALRSEACRATMAGAIRTSAGNYNLNTQGIANTLVPIPPLGEQGEIVAIATSCQTRLDAEAKFLASLRAAKAALMSALLTGEVRVTPDETPT